jgi:hypothetical protein
VVIHGWSRKYKGGNIFFSRNKLVVNDISRSQDFPPMPPYVLLGASVVALHPYVGVINPQRADSWRLFSRTVQVVVTFEK